MKLPNVMKVQLVFHSFFELWFFRLLVNKKELKWNKKTKSLSGNCTEAELELAVHAYHASVQDIHENANKQTK